MNSSKRVLVLGASGAMGQYLLPHLAESGYRIDGVSLDEVKNPLPGVSYIRANAKDRSVYRELLAKNYDGIVDFLTYSTAELSWYLPQALNHTDHYIFLSSCRVFDDLEHPVRESSPRLIDSSTDALLRNSDDYCIYKARGENILRASTRRNWTIVRPTTTYSFMRYQLVTLEAANNVGRAFAGKRVVVPEQAREKQATLSWGGDVARMLAGLLFLDRALGDDFNVATGEHHSWEEIAAYYKDICNLDAVWVDKEDYLRILSPDPYNMGPRWQLEYARLFTRVTDNSKILAAVGMKQSELLPLYDGLKLEIGRCPKDTVWPVNAAMDEYLAAMDRNGSGR